MNDDANQKKWTVMVYLAGDNNLSEDMITALKGMQAVGSSENVKLLACYDSVYPTTKIGYYAFPPVKAFGQQHQSGLRECRVQDAPSSGTTGGELDNAKALTGFVNWCVDNYQGDQYVLILSGHGDGFRGRTLLYDENPRGNLTLEQLKKTLGKIKAAGKISILGFDSCFMNMLEVAYELRGTADILVSSQSNVPNSGRAYEKVLQKLVTDNGAQTAEYYASDFVTQFNQFNYDYDVGGRSVNLSAVHLTKELPTKATPLDELQKCIGELAACLGAELDYPRFDLSTSPETQVKSDEKDQDLIKMRVIDLVLNAHWNSQTFMSDQAADIMDFCLCLKNNCLALWKSVVLPILEEECGYEVAPDDLFKVKLKGKYLSTLRDKLGAIIEICDQTVKAVKACVIRSCYSGYEFQYSNGISLYFPWSLLGYYISRDFYEKLEFAKTEGGKQWCEFLDKYTQETMRNSRTIDVSFDKTDPPIAKGDLSIYAGYFGRVKNVPVKSGTPDCLKESKAVPDEGAQ